MNPDYGVDSVGRIDCPESCSTGDPRIAAEKCSEELDKFCKLYGVLNNKWVAQLLNKPGFC